MYLFGRIGRMVFLGARQRAFNSATMWGTNIGLEAVADEAFMMALDMCGNAGQVSIIEQTGYQAFYEAVREALDDGDAYDVLMSACPYPEAVGEILEEVAGYIMDAAEEMKGDPGMGDDNDFEDAEDIAWEEGGGEYW